jgi:hypothetical protein
MEGEMFRFFSEGNLGFRRTLTRGSAKKPFFGFALSVIVLKSLERLKIIQEPFLMRRKKT